MAKSTHGMSGTRIYKIWVGMRKRCNTKHGVLYEDYAKRGISYSPEWDSFETFHKDMSATYADNLSLDRKDNDKGYSKSNCRWATPHEQMNNRRTSIHIMYKNSRVPLTVACVSEGIPRHSVGNLIRNGLSYQQAFDAVLARTQSRGTIR